jgi:SAM-dependent methyltransferase
VTLFDILACPICRGEVQSSRESLVCVPCDRRYAIVRGVPIMLPDATPPDGDNEAELGMRAGYDPWLHRMVLQSLSDAQVVVEIGCGNMALDDPCIIRTDVRWTPFVDLVADVHALPFKPGTVDFVFGLAVLEHLRNPFAAAASIHQALKPGGYVYGEANFVFAYHGYPQHFFNISVHGLEEVFSRFRRLRVGVAPYQTPSFAIESVIATYLSSFRGERASERRFAELLKTVLQYPLHSYDAAIPEDELFRTAAGGYFFGMKQDSASDTVIPHPITQIYANDRELQRRFPNPYDLAAPDNLMIWAMREGRRDHPAIADYFAALVPFTKSGDRDRPRDRSPIRSLPPIPDPDTARTIDEPDRAERESGAERSLVELARGIENRGPIRSNGRSARIAAEIGRARQAIARRLARTRVGIARWTGRGRSEEPPLPDPELIFAVCGTESSSWYLESGTFAAAEIRGALERSGVRMDRLGQILDFGCGAGRVLRHWRTLRGPKLHGTDYNPALVRWCAGHLPFAHFKVNPLDGPLPHRDGRFDFAYAFSVFTHLTEEQQLYWMRELRRVLRPGAYLYLTTHGEYYLPFVPPERLADYRRGALVVAGGDRAGSNVCAAFHPEPYVLNVLASGYRCVEFSPGRYPQDAYLFQRL